MPCNACDVRGIVYGWCNNEKVVYSEDDDKHYCNFHAPVGKKRYWDDNDVFKKIRDAKANKQKCYLSGTVFEKMIDFSQFNKSNPLPEIDFSYAEFKGTAWFDRVQFSEMANFNSAHFKMASFWDATFNGDVDFANAEFRGNTNFYVATFTKKAFFHGETFFDEADFSALKIDGKASIKFQYVNLKRVSFTDTDFNNITFKKCWKEKNDRYVLYEEVIALQKEPLDKNELSLVQSTYNRLKQKYKAEHNEAEASKWHYGEMEMKRKATSMGLNWLILNLYWATSGYEDMPSRALIGLFLIFVTLSALLGVTLTYESPYQEITVSNILINTIQNSFQIDTIFKPTTNSGKFISILMRTIIPIQFGFFSFALIKRYRR